MSLAASLKPSGQTPLMFNPLNSEEHGEYSLLLLLTKNTINVLIILYQFLTLCWDAHCKPDGGKQWWHDEVHGSLLLERWRLELQSNDCAEVMVNASFIYHIPQDGPICIWFAKPTFMLRFMIIGFRQQSVNDGASAHLKKQPLMEIKLIFFSPSNFLWILFKKGTKYRYT